MKTKKHINWKNVFSTLITLACVLVLVWFVASFIDVNLHNNYFSKNYGDFASWNIFTILF